MLKLSEIKDLIKLIDQTSVSELEIENEGSRICIRKHKPEAAAVAPVAVSAAWAPPAAAPAPASAQPVDSAPAAAAKQDSNIHTIVSPMVGTFYSAPAPDAAPFAKVGDRVGEKSIVCIVEAMKLMNEIEADVAGEITEVLVENGQLVEYGQPLFHVRKG